MYDHPGMQLLVEKVFSSLTDYWLGLTKASGKPYVFTTGEALAAASSVHAPPMRLVRWPGLQQRSL